MMEDTAISIKNVGKVFKLPHEKTGSIKSALISFRKRRTYEEQIALKDISLDIKKGEFFGIVGRNGSGKSTLLKLLAGIYVPTQGSININGSLTPFIELGVGFNPELTGRENVYLNGALLGFSRKQMEGMYKDIVDFAELDRFMDQKLKNYSSGMQVRLAFSIAIRADTDILVLDEVLAVGDAAFQKKCNAVFVELKKKGKTIVLVSHDMNAVKKFCTRVAVIDQGNLKGVYAPSEAAAVYHEINEREESAVETKTRSVRRWGDGKVKVKSLDIFSGGKKVKSIKQGEQAEFKIRLSSKSEQSIVLGLMFEDSDGVNVSGPNSAGRSLSSKDTITYKIDKVSLNPGDYKITAAVFNDSLTEEHDHIYNGFDLRIASGSSTQETAGKFDMFGEWVKGKK